jgi:hypothetical protein
VANNLLTDQHITQEAMMILENNLTFTKQVNREYQKEYKGPAKRGSTIYVKKPARYTVRDGQSVTLQDTTITQVPLVLNHQFGVDVDFTSQELTLSIEGFSQQVLQPQIVAIANAIDAAGLQVAAQSTSNFVGTPGTTPGNGTAQATMQLIGQSQALLDKSATPRDQNRAIVINEDAQANIIPSLSGLFQASSSIADQYKSGTMGYALGAKWSMSQNVYPYTTGNPVGAPKINGNITPLALAQGTTLAAITPFTLSTNGWTASATGVLKAGDVITVAGMFGVNPVSYVTTNKLLQMVVLADVNADGAGAATVSVGVPVITTGPFKTVAALPAINAVITVVSSPASTVTPQNIAFHKNAFTFATVDLPLPGGVHMAARKSDDQLGISLRFVAAYNVSTDQFIGRFDCLCGWAAIRPEWACRIAG